MDKVICIGKHEDENSIAKPGFCYIVLYLVKFWAAGNLPPSGGAQVVVRLSVATASP